MRCRRLLVIALRQLTLVQDNPFGLAAGPYLCVDVEDSGCGMSPDVGLTCSGVLHHQAGR